MFTGLVEETGKILNITPINGGKRISFNAAKVLQDCKVDDSICVNGVCLTVVALDNSSFTAEAVGETLVKSTLAGAKSGDVVNLERSVRLMDRLGGHLVQGHVTGTGTITKITNYGENYYVEIELPTGSEKYVIDEGSIAVDGISLTVAKVTGRKITLSVIPHTWKVTSLNGKSTGAKVNIEVDVIAKYVEKLLNSGKSGDTQSFSEDWFKQMGY